MSPCPLFKILFTPMFSCDCETYRLDTSRIERKLLFHRVNERVLYARSIFSNENYRRAGYLRAMRRFSHSMTNRFTHSTTNYRYQFKFLRSCTPMPELREMPLPSYIARCTTPCNWVPFPICRFPSILPRKNRVEMPLNYTNSIESPTPHATSWAMT